MPIKYQTPSSFSDFSCLGSECEDTCCQNWDVKIDRQHYELLKNAMSADKAEKKLFEQSIYLNTSPVVSEYDYAFIRMADSGYCAMLDSKGLCSVHAKHGCEVLGDVCTMFPRVISRAGDTIELSGAMSCPEVVRRCIKDNKPLKLSRFKPADLPRSKNYPILRELSRHNDDFYAQNFTYVREQFMQLIANETLPLETRLYTLISLANNLSEFYHRDCKKPGPGQVKSVIAAYMGKEFLTKLNAFISDYDAGSPVNMIVVHSILSIKLQQAENENISKLYNEIIQHYDVNNKAVPELLADKIKSIRQSLDKETQQFIDNALTRYILNCLYREWFVSMPDPFTYVQMLLVRLSMLRSLIYLAIGMEKHLTTEQVQEKIVYIMYNFARNIEQNLEFLKVVYNALSEQDMMNFDFSAAFIRID